MKPVYHNAVLAEAIASEYYYVLTAPNNEKWISCRECDGVGTVALNIAAVICDDCEEKCEHCREPNFLHQRDDVGPVCPFAFPEIGG